MQKISPFLWFNNQAEEAANFYISVFPNSKMLSTMPGPKGTVMGCSFELSGQKFMALNGGPEFKFSEAVSFYVDVDTQEEIDGFWSKLTLNGGQESQCGWLKDKYGLSWQIIPKSLTQMLGDPNREKAGRAMQAMLKMKKIIISDLKKAFEEKQFI